MKKVFLAFAVASLFVACNDAATSTPEAPKADTAVKAVVDTAVKAAAATVDTAAKAVVDTLKNK